MDKVICDICGTSYPATADQCPICGCEKPAETIMDEELGLGADPAPVYKPVKGGRFSDSNVRKRNKSAMAAPVQYDYDPDEEEDEEEEDDEEEYEYEETEVRSNKGLVAVLIFLIVAIVGLILYLYFNFFAPIEKPNKETEPAASTTVTTVTTAAPTETEAPTVPCTGLEVSETNIVLDAIGNAWLLNVVAAPADTTDSVTYASNNEAVATVSNEGCVTAVGPGEAVITVTCGAVVVECKVTCTIETEPVTEATEAPTEPELTWGLNRKEFMLRIGESWGVYEGEVSTALIRFTSKDTSVVTISKSGVVTGVGVGSTVVTAEYNGVVYECKVYCRQPKTETTPTETTPAETTPAQTTPPTTGSEEG